MAKDCLFYAIQYDDRSGHPDFNEGWYTGSQGAFRDTREGAQRRFEAAKKEAPEWFSVRLIECKVLDQVHGRNPLEHVG